jgi:hypothetical protein
MSEHDTLGKSGRARGVHENGNFFLGIYINHIAPGVIFLQEVGIRPYIRAFPGTHENDLF